MFAEEIDRSGRAIVGEASPRNGDSAGAGVGPGDSREALRRNRDWASRSGHGVGLAGSQFPGWGTEIKGTRTRNDRDRFGGGDVY
jgi:hypothetical protein